MIAHLLFCNTQSQSKNAKELPTQKPGNFRILSKKINVFKKAIVEVYNGRCAISGMKLEFGASISMVDACHIVPFAQSYDDTIHNGIALSPTMHRAFDRGLVSVSDDYRVLVNPRLRDHYPEVGIFSNSGVRSLYFRGIRGFILQERNWGSIGRGFRYKRRRKRITNKNG